MSQPISSHLFTMAIRKPKENYKHLLEAMTVNIRKHGNYTQVDCRCAECLAVTPQEWDVLNEKLKADILASGVMQDDESLTPGPVGLPGPTQEGGNG